LAHLGDPSTLEAEERFVRRLLHAFFALAVFLAAGGSAGTFARDCAPLSASHCGDMDGLDGAALHSCCCDASEHESAINESCSSRAQKCGTSPAASIQLSQAKERAVPAQDASPRTNVLEPKPWPLSLTALAWADADGSTLPNGAWGRRSGSRSWAEASLPGESTLDRISRLSVFRI
ncbi:MAG: hypothetical protein KGN80_12540, partial [Acidobacteriota bacterium]|nr:hypothetical protein [Acidobacteriota bacterium]